MRAAFLVLIRLGLAVMIVLAGVVLSFWRKRRRLGLVLVVIGAALLCCQLLRAHRRNTVVMSIARDHQTVHIGMTKLEVEDLLGEPDFIASSDPTGELETPWGSRDDVGILTATEEWEYRPYGGLHSYRVYFDADGRVIGKAAD